MSDAAKRAEIGMCLLLAGADDEISEIEIGALSTRLGVLLGDDFPTRDLASIVDDELLAMDALGADGYVASLLERLPPGARLPALRSACTVAFADGAAPEEVEGALLLGEALGIEVTAVTALLPESQRP